MLGLISALESKPVYSLGRCFMAENEEAEDLLTPGEDNTNADTGERGSKSK